VPPARLLPESGIELPIDVAGEKPSGNTPVEIPAPLRHDDQANDVATDTIAPEMN
jgi:hypothetical protein